MKNETTLEFSKSGIYFREPGETLILENTGLHVSQDGIQIQSPFIYPDTFPYQTIKGFRNKEYVCSQVVLDKKAFILSSVSCNIPVFLYRIRSGTPVSAPVQVFLPPTMIRKAGTIDLASDGNTLYSKRKCIAWSRAMLLKKQLSDFILLESIIEFLHIHT